MPEDMKPTGGDTQPPSETSQQNATNTTSTNATSTVPPVKKNKKLIGGIIAAVAAVLVIGGAVFAYFWYQNPEKMVADAFANAAKSESVVFNGSVVVTQDDAPQNVNVTFDGKSAGNRAEANIGLDAEGDGVRIAANGSIIFAGDDGLFAKVSNIRETLETAFQDEAGSEEMVNLIVERLDDKWIKLDADSNEGMTREYEEQRQCINDAMKSFTENRDHQKQLADAYRNNRVLMVKKLGTEAIDGVNSHRFEVSVDESKIQGFVDALRETDAAKTLNNCSEGDIFADTKEMLEEMTQESMGEGTKMELWVSTWSHELTQVRIHGADEDGEASGDITLKTKFNEEVNIETPTDATPVQDVMNDLMGAIFSYSMRQQGAPADYEVDQDLMLDLNTR